MSKVNLINYDLYDLLKCHRVSYGDLEEVIQIRSRELPAYEAVFQKSLKEKAGTAEIRQVNGIDSTVYHLAGYDHKLKRVFLKPKPERYGGTSFPNGEVKAVAIEEFIFEDFKIFDEVDIDAFTVKETVPASESCAAEIQ